MPGERWEGWKVEDGRAETFQYNISKRCLLPVIRGKGETLHRNVLLNQRVASQRLTQRPTTSQNGAR